MTKGLIINKKKFEKLCNKLCLVIGRVKYNINDYSIVFGKNDEYKVIYEFYEPEKIEKLHNTVIVTPHLGKLKLIRTKDNKEIAVCSNKKEIDNFIVACQISVIFDIIND